MGGEGWQASVSVARAYPVSRGIGVMASRARSGWEISCKSTVLVKLPFNINYLGYNKAGT